MSLIMPPLTDASDTTMNRSKKDIERDEQIYQLSTLVAGAFSLQEVLDKLEEVKQKIMNCEIHVIDKPVPADMHAYLDQLFPK